jgi:hypothetical protein
MYEFTGRHRNWSREWFPQTDAGFHIKYNRFVKGKGKGHRFHFSRKRLPLGPRQFFATYPVFAEETGMG